MTIYTGYVYIWYDTIARLFYVGGHHGKTTDTYVCSNKPMKRAYKKRPKTFRFRVLQYVNGSTDDLRRAEQHWLNLIKNEELLLTENVRNKTVRYYNVKKNAVGGNGIGTNKGKSTIGGHNKGKPMSEEQKKKISAAHKGKPKSKAHVTAIRKARNKHRLVLLPVQSAKPPISSLKQQA